MDLNQLAFTPRKRSPWQVFDLAQLFVKENFWGLLKVACASFLPVAILLGLFVGLSWAPLIFWWLKPLMERPLLTYLAKRSFNQPVTVKECLLSLKKLRVVNVLLMLTIHRLSPNRAYLSPVDQLEMQKGKAAQQRKALLLGRGNHKQTLWMLFCVHFEVLLAYVLMAIAITFVPQGVPIDLQLNVESIESWAESVLYFVCLVTSTILIALYFVTGGFLAYLNSRIKLEGWDIELSFKRIAKRLGNGFAVLLMGFTMLLPTSFDSYANPAQAQAALVNEQSEQSEQQGEQEKTDESTETEKKAPTQADETREQVAEIYKEHELTVFMEIFEPTKEEETEVDAEWLANFIKFLATFGPALGYIMIAIIVVLLIWLIRSIYENRNNIDNPQKFTRKLKQKAPKVTPKFIQVDNQKFDWPEDLLANALSACAEGKLRLALTYVLKYALDLAQANTDVALDDSMTEQECERALIKATPSAVHPHYRQLFLLWVQHAWGHREIEPQQVEQLVNDFTTLTRSNRDE